MNNFDHHVTSRVKFHVFGTHGREDLNSSSVDISQSYFIES